MLTSSVLNSITFKEIDGKYPLRDNRMHIDRHHAMFRVIPFTQKYPIGHNVRLQFISDNYTVVPQMKLYTINGRLRRTIAGSLGSSYTGGVVDRWFFDHIVRCDAALADQCLYLEIINGQDTLRSEPFVITDLTDEINNGSMLYIKYKNADRESDKNDHYVDFSAIPYMDFFLPSVMMEPANEDSIEVLEGSMFETVVSATLYAGNRLKTAPMPEHMALKLTAASALDDFEVNGKQMIRKGAVSSTMFGQSTLMQLELNLVDKMVLGLNVDDFGITSSGGNDSMAIITKRNNAVDGNGWNIENPQGYMLHSIWITHDGASTATTATVTLGTAAGGTDLIDALQGEIPRTPFNFTAEKWKIYTQHYLKNPDVATQLFFSVAGAGAILQIIVNFERIIENP